MKLEKINTENMRFFVHCPRGFINERSLWGSNDEEIIETMYRIFDDGMELTFEEVSEEEAKTLYYKKGVEPDYQAAYANMSLEETDKINPYRTDWDTLKKVMALDTKIRYELMWQ